MRALAALLAASLATPALAADGPLRRFAVVAGASLGGPGRTPLRYATSDARDVSRVLRRLGGVALDDLVLVEEPDADRLRAALGALAAGAERARQAGRRVEVFLYYSGHSDDEALLLGGSRLPYAELRRELARIPADVRVAILDSCSSGAITRAKGGVHRPPFLLDESSRVTGHAFLTSSAADEAAQESDKLRASFFTHALLTGLRGAADASGDGVVTLNEAYQFAFRETLAGTEASQAGPQHATYDIGLVGSGDVVMTDLRGADALLVVPEAIEGRVFVRNAAGQLVAELRKLRGTRIELALDEGRYAVQIAQERRVLAGSVDLAASRREVLDEARLSPGALERTASRGTAEEPRPEGAPRAAHRWTGWVALRGGALVAKGMDNLTGVDARLGAGLWLAGEVLGTELSVGYSRVAGTTTGRLPGDGVFRGGAAYNANTGEVRDQNTTVPVTVALRLSAPLPRLRPYITGGLGIYLSRFERRPARDYVWAAPGSDRLHEERIELGTHVAFGAAVRMSRRAELVLEARYDWGRGTRVFQQDIATEALRVGGGVQLGF